MSVLLKGMNMPRDGEQLKVWIEANGQVIVDKRTYYEEYEAVELPDHGDLIERDRLHHDLKADAIDKFAILDDTYLRYLEGLEKAEELLLGATVVIPAERSEK